MKRLLIAGVILILSAGAAGATGLNLAWDNCFGSTGATQNKDFTCDDSSPGAMDANTQTFTAYGSIIPGIDLTGMLSWTAWIDWQVANATLDDWWRLRSGECRDGGIGLVISGFSNTSTCNKQMMASQGIGISDWQYLADKPANWARFQATASRTTGFNVVGTVHYQAFAMLVNTINTKINGDGTTVACAGCLDAACIVFNEFEMDIPPVGGDTGKNFVSAEDTQRWVTWQGGSIGGTGCPASVPTRRTSWGQVKSLYR